MGGRPSDGEIYYVWSFLLWGSIVQPDVRWRLRRAWGFCERHSWVFLSVEAAFRPSFPHASTLLYEDLLERACRVLGLAGPRRRVRLRHVLEEQGPCIMCEMHYGPGSAAVAPADVLERGGDMGSLLNLAESTKPWWREAVCGVCSGEGQPARCRRHLLNESRDPKTSQLEDSGSLIRTMTEHITRYARSFRWELRGTETDEDRADPHQCRGLVRRMEASAGTPAMTSSTDRRAGYVPQGAAFGGRGSGSLASSRGRRKSASAMPARPECNRAERREGRLVRRAPGSGEKGQGR